jgi:hypothetical protein
MGAARTLKVTGRGEVRLYEDPANGAHYLAHKAAASMAASATLTWPDALPAGARFLQSDAAGVLTWELGAASSLDASYGVGHVVTVDAGAIEFNSQAAHGDVALDVTQADDFAGMTITKTGVGAGSTLLLTNAGTGVGADIVQNGIGIGLRVTQNAAEDAAQIVQTQDDNGLFVQKSGLGAGDGLNVQNLGTGPAIHINQDGSGFGLDIDIAVASSQNGIRIVNNGTGAGQLITQAGDAASLDINKTGAGAGDGINVNNDGTGAGIFITQDGVGKALDIDQNANENALRILNDGGKSAILVQNDTGWCFEAMVGGGSGGINVDVQTTNLFALELEKAGAGGKSLVHTNNAGTGPSFDIDQTGNGIGIEIDSEATSQPLLNLAPITGNTRGDIAFGSVRIADPATPSAGDVWFDSVAKRFRGRLDGSASRTLVGMYQTSFGDPVTVTLATDVAVPAPKSSHLIVAAETGTADDLATINTADAEIGDEIILIADAGDTITVKHNVGNIRLDSNADKSLVNRNRLTVMWDGTDWVQSASLITMA